MLNKSVYNAHSAPALCVIEEDVDHGTLYISQFVAVCPHSHLEKQSETAIPNIVQSQVKVTVATPPAHIEERPGRLHRRLSSLLRVREARSSLVLLPFLYQRGPGSSQIT